MNIEQAYEPASGVKKFPDATAIPGHSFSYQYDGIGNRAPGDETHSSTTQGGTGTGVKYTTNALNQYTNIVTEGGRFILGEAPLAHDVVITTAGNPTVAERAGGLGFYWKQLTGDNSAGPLWSNDSVASDGVTITGNTWTPPNSVTPVHDDDGNLTYDGRWDYSWDAENRLTRMQTTDIAAAAGVPRQRLDFVYDSQNRRVSKTVHTSTDGTNWTFSSSLRSLYDGWNLIAEYSAPSETSTTLTLQAAHLWGIDLSGTPQGAGGVGGLLCSTLIGENSTTNNCYPAYDGNGNISAWLGASGNLLARMDYSPFGQLVTQYKFTGTGDTTLSRLHFGFSTKYTDSETGHLYYIQRYYDPVTGRWRSRDPIEEDGGPNLNAFCGNRSAQTYDILGFGWPFDTGAPGSGFGYDQRPPSPSEVPLSRFYYSKPRRGWVSYKSPYELSDGTPFTDVKLWAVLGSQSGFYDPNRADPSHPVGKVVPLPSVVSNDTLVYVVQPLGLTQYDGLSSASVDSKCRINVTVTVRVNALLLNVNRISNSLFNSYWRAAAHETRHIRAFSCRVKEIVDDWNMKPQPDYQIQEDAERRAREIEVEIRDQIIEEANNKEADHKQDGHGTPLNYKGYGWNK